MYVVVRWCFVVLQANNNCYKTADSIIFTRPTQGGDGVLWRNLFTNNYVTVISVYNLSILCSIARGKTIIAMVWWRHPHTWPVTDNQMTNQLVHKCFALNSAYHEPYNTVTSTLFSVPYQSNSSKLQINAENSKINFGAGFLKKESFSNRA